jgi:hypothetical protein
MKKIIYDNPNKMHIETGNKGFDKACKILCNGNAFTDTQTSYYIRAKTDVECNGLIWTEGELRKADLKVFRDGRNPMPSRFEDMVLKATETESAILYEIFHYRKGEKIFHGWILTKTHKANKELICYYAANYRSKTYMVMEEVVQYLSNPKPMKTVETKGA